MVESQQVLEWQHEGIRVALRELLQERFGTVPDPVWERIETTTDPERLLSAVRQVLHINAPDELQL